MADQYSNFAYSTVATPPSPATTGTSITVATGTGTRFPSTAFTAEVWPAGAQPSAANAELIRVAAGTGDTRTITRAINGTTARTIVAGDQFQQPFTAQTVDEITPRILAQGAAIPGGTPAGVPVFRTSAPSYIDYAVPVSKPSNPVAGLLRSFIRNLAGRPHLATVDQYGHDVTLQPHLGRNKVGRFTAIGNVTGIIADSFGAPGTQGTASGVNVTTGTSPQAVGRTRRVKYATAATAGTLAELRTGAQQFSAGTGIPSDGAGFTATTRWVNSDAATVSGARMFVGMTASTTANATNVEPSSLVNSVGVAQLSTDATQWYAVCAGTTAQTPVALGTALGRPDALSANIWECIVDAHPGRANTFVVTMTDLVTGLSVSTTFSNASAAVVPISSQLLGWKMFRTNNATALAVAFDFIQHYIETDN